MKKISFVLILLLFIVDSIAQNISPCFKDVISDSYKAELPNEVCIPQGYLLDAIYDSTDIDTNGLLDFIFRWRKKDLSDGDTIFVTFYKQISIGKYQYYKTLSNILPIYFKSYSLSYRMKDKKIDDIQSGYNGMYPLSDLEIRGRNIRLSIKCAVGESYNLHYEFDTKINNWILVKCEKLTELLDEKTIEPIDLKGKKLLIDDFNYFDYMYQNLSCSIATDTKIIIYSAVAWFLNAFNPVSNLDDKTSDQVTKTVNTKQLEKVKRSKKFNTLMNDSQLYNCEKK